MLVAAAFAIFCVAYLCHRLCPRDPLDDLELDDIRIGRSMDAEGALLNKIGEQIDCLHLIMIMVCRVPTMGRPSEGATYLAAQAANPARNSPRT